MPARALEHFGREMGRWSRRRESERELAGFAFASAMRSLTDLPAKEGVTTTTLGCEFNC